MAKADLNDLINARLSPTSYTNVEHSIMRVVKAAGALVRWHRHVQSHNVLAEELAEALRPFEEEDEVKHG